ncbi:MAG: SagB family peptide dehydrogenase [Spirochaetia bacterium]|nr:SagB family peptide dehydrogenase [Spirochaetia bacterium]
MNGQARWFASDNNASIHPRILSAIQAANGGHAIGYGDDRITREAEAAVADIFGPGSVVRFAVNGTGANVYALSCLAGHGDAVFCSDCAHILVDETGAPAAMVGAQLVPLQSRHGKLDASAVAAAIDLYGDMHKPRPRVLSLSQPTELGTVYTPAELAELCALAHDHGLAVHVDGARLANAAAALNTGPAEAAGDADAVCFGGTKNGLMFGEAVVFPNRPGRALPDTARLRKTSGQLASKMRFLSAQFLEYAKDGLWLENARAANAMAARLAQGVRRLGLRLLAPVDTNAVFAFAPKAVVEELRERAFFYDWEDGAVRWMASWDTTEADVDTFLAALEASLKAHESDAPERTPAMDAELERRLTAGRAFLKAGWHDVERFPSDQMLGRAAPPLRAPAPEGATIVALPDPQASGLGAKAFSAVTASRRSRRKFSQVQLSLAELSFLLWATAGVRDREAASKPGAKFAFRTVPSGGCRHPLDLLVYARAVDGLPPGLYRFLPESHALALLKASSPLGHTGFSLDAEFDAALLGQLWNCAALFVWNALPYRAEWRYTVAAAKLCALDAGHACQALYGACEALGLGTCAIGAYDQELMDTATGADGTDEFTIYAAPVGRPRED